MFLEMIHVCRKERDTNSPRDHPVRIISDYYAIAPHHDGTVDVVLIPHGRIALLPDRKTEPIDIDNPLIVRGIVPWSGIEADIRANYRAWCDMAEQIDS